MYMSYVISYGSQDTFGDNYNNTSLSSIYSTYNITQNSFTLTGTRLVDTSFNLHLNYSSIQSVNITYTITAIRLE
jgi:hypothetical protein